VKSNKFRSTPTSAATHAAVAVLLTACTLDARATQSQTRVNAYEYEPASRVVTKALIESDVSILCVIVQHTIDAYGHTTDSTKRNCAGAAGTNAPYNNEAAAPPTGSLAIFANRTEHATFTDPRYANSLTDAAGQKIGLVNEPAFGSLATVVDFNMHNSTFKIDGFGRKVLESRPDGTGKAWTYKYCTTSPGGTESCPTVGDLAAVYVISETPINTASGAQNGPATLSYFDATGKLLRTQADGFDGAGAMTVYTDYQYDAAGRAGQVSRPYYSGATIYWTTFQYDALGRTVLVTTPDGGQTSTTYNGQTVTVRDAMGHNTVTMLDANGQIASITDHLGHSSTFTFTAFGEATSATDSAGNVVTQGRDLLGHVTSMNDPDLGAETYGYNAVGDVVSKQNARGDVTTRGFDAIDRLTSSQTTNYQGNWYFGVYADGSPCPNGIGALCDVTGKNGFKEHYQFDSVSRPSVITETIDKNFQTTLGYDATTGKLSSVQYPNGVAVNTNYTAKGFPISLTDASSGATYWHLEAVNADMSIAHETYGAGIVSQSGFDPTTGRLLTRSAAASATLQNLSVGYDYVGNLTSRTDLVSGVFATYQYDELNRLLSETRQGGAIPDRRAYSNWFPLSIDDDLTIMVPAKTVVTPGQNITWVYDNIGNIVSRSDVGTYSYAPSGANSVRPHAVSGVTGTVNGISNPSYVYDASGALMTGGGRSATFDNVEDQPMPTGFTRGAATLNFWYAPNKRRVKETSTLSGALQRTTNYVHPDGYAGLLYEEDVLAGGALRQRSYLSVEGQTIGAVLSDGTNRSAQFWLKDHLGSVDVLADMNGNLVERLDYEPFGKRRANGATDPTGTLASANSNRGFTGHEELDEVGLVHMNGRVYDPSIGRFVSADPYIPSPSNPQSYNRYAYVNNNPLSLTDPTGYAETGAAGTNQGSGNSVDSTPQPSGDGSTSGRSDATGKGVDNIDTQNRNTTIAGDSTTNAPAAPSSGDETLDEQYRITVQRGLGPTRDLNAVGAAAIQGANDATNAAGPVAKEVAKQGMWLFFTDGIASAASQLSRLRGLLSFAGKAGAGGEGAAAETNWFRSLLNKIGGKSREASGEIQKVEVVARRETISLESGFGHTFRDHGEGATVFLTKRAAGANKAMGQFTDNQAAAHLIRENLHKLKNGAQSIPIPSDFPARIILPDGSFVPATSVRMVPSGNGVKTAYPER